MVNVMPIRLITSFATVRLISVLLSLFLIGSIQTASASVRIKDLCDFQSSTVVDLIGYGLVIGLDGTGDGTNTQFTIRSLANMVKRMGLTVDAEKMKVKNIAAVIITAKINSDQANGMMFDVTVSSIGDASSLQGGTLLMTPLSTPDGIVRGTAQGPVSIGGFNVQVDEGNRIVNNYTLVGRIPSGGRISNPVPGPADNEPEIRLALREPDLTTANRIAEQINIEYGTTSYADGAGSVRLIVPDSLNYPELRPRFLANVGQLGVIPDNVARVVINERTGTIVSGKYVTIEAVAIAHGTITVSIQSTPDVSQPESFSGGQTTTTRQTTISVDQPNARVVELAESVSLSDVAAALNKIGATPRDIVSIFQALKAAGALRAELVII